jgi:hypothetical protein
VHQDLSQQIQQQLTRLLEAAKRDSDALRSQVDRFPDGRPIFDRLFDAVQSTLQNASELSADKPE